MDGTIKGFMPFSDAICPCRLIEKQVKQPAIKVIAFTIMNCTRMKSSINLVNNLLIDQFLQIDTSCIALIQQGWEVSFGMYLRYRYYLYLSTKLLVSRDKNNFFTFFPNPVMQSLRPISADGPSSAESEASVGRE